MSRGLRVPLQGFAFLREHPALWPYLLPAGLVNVLITGVALAVLIAAAVLLIDGVVPQFGEGWWQTTLMVLTVVGIAALVIGATVVCWLLLQNIIAGHLLSKLAERVERELGIDEGQITSVPFVWQVRDGALDTGLVLAIHSVAFVVGLVPVIGTVVGFVAAFGADALVMGFDMMGHPMKLRGKTFTQRRAFVREHLPETMGIGVVTLPLGLVPVVGGFVAAFSLVGTVLLYRELAGEVSPEA
ncbi:MAG: EI24 domain-containing protein [Planctomycetota bacterium]